MNFTPLQESEAVCQQQFGANLVSIDTEEEAEKLCEIVSDRYCVLCVVASIDFNRSLRTKHQKGNLTLTTENC